MPARRPSPPAAPPDLFDTAVAGDATLNAPLADRLRPRTLVEFVGQEKVIGPTTILRQSIENDELFSMILWGPPGSGKTTLARIIAGQTKSVFVALSGVMSSKDDLLQAVASAQDRRKLHRQRTILFVDEIHRWNKAQQDALLPYVESGVVTLIGATTENPSFEVISPLLSRCKVFVLDRLTPEDLTQIVAQALTDERGYGGRAVEVEPKAMELLAAASNGDARTVLNTLELAVKATAVTNRRRLITLKTVADAFQKPQLLYDKKGDEHYNIISAFIKSMRGSQPDAALYWLARMLEAGEDPLFIARRMVIFASEDVSLADTHALPLAVACMQACDMIGLPECSINLSHVTTYLATCPKSNETYTAYGRAKADVEETMNEPVPLNLRNAPTKLMKELGYHRGYKYSHNYSVAEAGQEYRPKKLAGHEYYVPFLNPHAKRTVFIVPYRKTAGGLEIWIGNKKSVDGSLYWQCVRGSVEAGEDPVTAARREMIEEIGVSAGAWMFTDLHHVHSFDVHGVTVTEYAFALDVTGRETRLNDEHAEEKWVTPDQAITLFNLEDNRETIRVFRRTIPQ